MARYTISGGSRGKERLDLLAEVMWPSTFDLLTRLGLREGDRCLDVGSGGGHVAIGMAQLVGSAGRVLGIDLDGEILELARRDAVARGLDNVEFHVGYAEELAAQGYDFVYARFLLSHVSDPLQTVRAMAAALRPDGVLAVEDIDFTGCFCHPVHAAYDRYVAFYRETVRHRGGDADIGPGLPELLRVAGLARVGMHLVQPAHLAGKGKRLQLSTLELISDAALAEGVATQAELDDTLSQLAAFTDDPQTIVGCPRVFQAWGYRA